MAAPKLRFKEFDGDWISKKIIDLADYVDYRGKTPKKVESGILLVTAKNIKQGYLDYSASQEFIEESAFDDVMRRGKVELNDVLITTEAPLGNVASVDRTDIALAQRVIKYRGKSALLDNLFLKQKFLSESFQEILKSKATGGTVQGIKGSVLHQIPLIVPSKAEQTKIATFLSAVDEKISQLTQKHQLLSQYKQGMMQKLFSQQIRFKADNGSEFGEWESKKISDLFDEVRNKVADRDIETYSITAGKGFVSQANKFGRDISGKQNSNYIVLKPNDFSYNKGNSKTYKYGCVYLNELTYDIAVPNVFISFRSKKQNLVHEKFYSKLFEFHYLDRYLRLLISSSARMDGLLNVSKDGFFEIKLPYPCLEEQTKIANFLSAIDQKIEVTSQQIEQAKQWKKGLLQQMFV